MFTGGEAGGSGRGEEGEGGVGEGEEGDGEGKASVEIPDHKTQKQEIHAVLNQRLKVGDTW